jgi:hypothetical protein
VMTTSIVATMNFGGNIEKVRIHLLEFSYIPRILGKRCINRRLHLRRNFS